MSAFHDFAQTAECVGATTKRLEKAAILGEYFSALGDDELLHAARYFAGTIFPLRDQRTVNIGGAALLAAIRAVTNADETHLRTRAVTLGDMGDVAGTYRMDFARTGARNNGTVMMTRTRIGG